MSGDLIFTRILALAKITGSLSIAFGADVFYALASFALGWVILRKLIGKEGISFWALLVSAFMLGQAILSVAWITLGLTGDFRKYIIISILAFLILLGIIFSKGLWKKIIDELKTVRNNIASLSRGWKIVLGIAIVAFAVMGVGGVTHVIEIDSEAFYMSLPKIMAFSERLRPHPLYYDFTQIGLFGEMHQAALMSFSNFEAAKAFTWFIAIAVIIMTLSITSLGKVKIKGLLVALILLLTSSTFFLYIGSGKIDLYGAALGLVAYYWALKTDTKNYWPAVILAGLFTGFTGIAKFAALPVVVPGVIFLIIWNRYLVHKASREKFKKFIKSMILTGLVFLAFFILPLISHLIKNQVLFHEPLAPFLFFHSHGTNWADQAWLSPANAHYVLLIYPLALVFGMFPMQGGTLSALTIGFLVLVFLRRPRGFLGNKIFQVLAAAALGTIIWMIMRPAVLAPRYIFATILLFIPVVAYLVDSFLEGSSFRLLKAFVPFSLGLLMLIVLVSVGTGVYYEITDSNKYVNSISYASSQFLNQKALKGERVFVAGFSTFYLRADLLECLNTPRDDINIFDLSRGLSWEDFSQKGFKYVYVQKIYAPTFDDVVDIKSKPDWLEVNHIYSDNNTTIYALNSADSNKLPSYQCENTHRNVWDVVLTPAK